MTAHDSQTPARTAPDLEAIRDAARLIGPDIVRTPFLPAPKLSQIVGTDILVKYENMQVTNSFKDRGALVRMLQLSDEERRNGVIAMSAGNHAQSVAHHASRLGIAATIVMPEPTPFVKVQSTQSRGARVVLKGETLAESQLECERLQAEQGLTLIHPYNDPDVIRGQGTIALEMLEDAPDLDTIVVPIGGGGLISGIAIAAKALKPDIAIIGTETALYPSMWGDLTLSIVRDMVDDIILVDEPSIERAVNAYLTHQKTMAEGAGAAGLAAVMMAPERFAGRKVGLVLCGGNIDARILASIMVRELARGERIVAIRVVIHDRPGVLGEIAAAIGRLGGNILEVSHHRLFLNIPAKGTSVDFTIETRDAAHAAEIVAGIEALGLTVERVDAAESHF